MEFHNSQNKVSVTRKSPISELFELNSAHATLRFVIEQEGQWRVLYSLVILKKEILPKVCKFCRLSPVIFICILPTNQKQEHWILLPKINSWYHQIKFQNDWGNSFSQGWTKVLKQILLEQKLWYSTVSECIVECHIC